MKKMHCAAAVTTLILAGCAGPQASLERTQAAGAAPAGLYCAKDRLLTAGTRLECNWQPSAEEACKFGEVSTVERAELAGDPQPAGRCNTGQWLVRVARR